MKFQKLKIAITDEVHLKAVCDVLKSMGYKPYNSVAIQNFHKWLVCDNKGYIIGWLDTSILSTYKIVTLTDLLKMRDEQAMEKIRE